MANSSAVDHILGRLSADIDFLVSANLMTVADAQVIRARLPALGSTAPLVTGMSGLAMHGTGPEPMPAGHNGPQQSPVRAVPAPPPRASPAIPQQPTRHATALWAFDSGTPGDLTFAKGDVIEITETPNEHWYRGRVHGREGIFPANHVQMLDASTPNAFAPMPHGAGMPSSYGPTPYQAFAPPPYGGGPPGPSPYGQYQSDPKISQPPVQQAPQPAKKPGRFGGGMGSTLAHAGVGES